MTSAHVSKTCSPGKEIGTRLTRFAICRRAAAAIEFALTLPVLILLVLGIIEFAMMTFVDVMLEAGLREASRYGITGSGSEDQVTRYRTIEQIVLDRTMNLAHNVNFQMQIFGGFGDIGSGTGTATTLVQEPNPSPPPDTIWVVYNPDDASSVVLYTVTADYRPLTPLLPSLLGWGDVIELTASVAVRNEPWLTSGGGGS